MFSMEFDLVIMAICLVLAVFFFLGKGEKILRAFGSRDDGMKVKRRRTPEEERRYQRAIGIFVLVIAACEGMMAFLSDTYTWIAILDIAIVIAALIVFVFYLKKNFPDT